MIKLKNFHTGDNYPKHVHIDEKTMSVDHYDEGVTSEQLDQTITPLQKAINNICDMTFYQYPFNITRRVIGENNDMSIEFDSYFKWVLIRPNDKNWLIQYCVISPDDFKNLLVSQHKDNELSYLLLKGVLV